MDSLLLRLLLLQLIEHALARYMSIPTPTIRLHQGRLEPSPRATTTPLALLPRDEPPPLLTNSLTCGYTSGLWYSAVTCNPDYSCTYYTTPYAAPNFGCCSAGKECGYVSTCIDYDPSNTQVGAGLFLDGDDYYCGSDLPYCLTILLYGQEYASGGTYSFFSYGCRTGKSTTITAYQHTIEDTARDSSASPSSATSTTTTSHSTAEPSSVVSSLAATSSAAVAATAAAPQGLSEGARIGIGVGTGIFAAVALVAALLWFRHRSRARFGFRTDTKAHLDGIDHQGGSVAGCVNDSFVGGKASMQELDNDHARVELASNPRRYELGGNHPQELFSVVDR